MQNRFYYPITPVTPFKTPQGRGSCFQQFASVGPHGLGENRFTVVFDEDIDFRVFERIDALFKIAAPEVPNILIVGERKGSLTVVFKGKLPEALKDTSRVETALDIMATDGDFWNVHLFAEVHFMEYAGHLCHPPMTPEAFVEAITWNV